ncbi:hypothetical protein QBC40DRAFT_288674 [Triangularia verruculosa]|uniref:Uncharacterized protein n=1 Tax=Triangularia verruculosa TaxID=2587418 RepID=A0AAN6XBQ7_9PEZI|nr:hypothetical protein QBC40DRAFT_288674 [Triangularia verruculosa]
MDTSVTEMDATTFLHISSLAWLLAQAVPLTLWPSFIITLLSSANYYPSPHSSKIETYLARSLGLSQLFFALLLLVLSGLLPLEPSGTTTSNNPYAQAAVLITTLYHTAAGIYSYTRYNATGGQVAYLIGCLGSGFLSCVGLYVLLFGDGKRLSRRTGADKSTSGWPFRNAEADKKKKKSKR